MSGSSTKYTTDQLVAPSGLCLFAQGAFTTALGAMAAGWDEIANTSAVKIAIETATSTQDGGDGPVAQELLRYPTSIKRSGEISTLNITERALELWGPMTTATKTLTTGAELAQAINGGVALVAGKRYLLGVSSARPTGAKLLTSVSIKTGATTYTAGTHYILDPDYGRWIYIPAGSTCVGAICTSDHTLPTKSYKQQSTTDTSVDGAFWFLSHNTAGAHREFFCPRVNLVASGDLMLKAEGREERMSLTWSMAILPPLDGSAALLVDGEPY